MAWTYNAKSRRYHNDKTGRFLSNSQMVGLRDQFSERQKARTDALAESMAEGNLTAQQWVYGMRKQITTSFVDQYALGRGGRNAMTEDDWSTVEGLLKNQYQYLNGFASDIVGGELSLARIKQRAAMYMDASTQAYERGRAIAFGLPELPAYPGDGQTECKSNCKCRWIYDITDETIDCYWTLGGAEHCPGCVENAAQWNPLSFDTETKNITIKEEVFKDEGKEPEASKDEGEEPADYVPFVRKGDFGDYYKNELGINNVVDLDTMRIDDINMITKTLYDLKHQGAKLPDKFEVHDQVWFDNKGHEHSHAFYDVSFDKIAINRDSTFWKDNAAGRTSTFETYIRTNFLSVSDSSDHAYLLRHELGHANHGGDVHVRWEKLPEKMLEDVGGELSHYGKVSKGEFVAETFAGMTGGRTYSDQLMDYYKEYGGKVL